MGSINRLFIFFAILAIGLVVVTQTVLSRFSINQFLPKAPAEAPVSETLFPEQDHFIVPLERLAGVWVARVVFNEFHEARLIVDTGATFVTISEDLAFDAGVYKDSENSYIELFTAGGRVKAEMGLVGKVRVGDAARNDVRVVVHSIPDFPDGIDGLLGLSFFDQFLVRLDQSKQQLHLSPKK
jgi:clan AA aspartic protease (TIGR02281 family)